MKYKCVLTIVELFAELFNFVFQLHAVVPQSISRGTEVLVLYALNTHTHSTQAPILNHGYKEGNH